MNYTFQHKQLQSSFGSFFDEIAQLLDDSAVYEFNFFGQHFLVLQSRDRRESPLGIP